MAISITQKPTTPNAAYTYLPYVVSGSVTTGNPQYSYVMDIYESGSSTRLNRITQVPNPSGVAVFDPSRLLQTKLSYDNNWKTLGSTDKVNAVKTFEIKFGEQYSTSISSSVTVYPDLATHELEVFPAVIDPNNGSSYNFNTSSFAETGNRFLTNFPGVERGLNNTVPQPNGYPYICDSSDYMTLTSFNEDYQTSNMITVSGYFLSSSRNWVNPVGNALWSVNLTGASDGYFTTYGIGPKNISEFDSIASASIASGATNMLYTSNVNGGAVIAIENNWNGGFMVTGSAIGNTYNVWDFSKVQLPQNNEYIRFAFINDYGFYDYYNVYSPIQRRTKVDRKNVSLPKINYSGTAVPYSSKDGGETSYYTDLNDTYTVTTQWLDKEMANYLEELLDSPEVFVQQDDEFVPVVINNQSYISNQSTARNKLFQYTIELSPANGRDLESRITSCNPQPEPAPTPTPTPTPVPPIGPFGEPTWYYNSQQVTAPTAWDDTLTTGSNFPGNLNGATGALRIRYKTNQTVGGYTGDWWELDPEENTTPFFFNKVWTNGFNGSAAGLTGSNYTLQSWVYINEFSEVDGSTPRSTFFTLSGDTLFFTNEGYRVTVGSLPSGSNNILTIATDTSGLGTVRQTFPEQIIETGSWYQISLVQDGTNFNDFKVYVNNGSAYSPTASVTMNISGSYQFDAGTDDNDKVLSGSIANVICYATSSLTQEQNAESYQGIKNYLESL